MTYDILFLRVLPGRTFDETLDEINSAYDPDAELKPMNLTGEQRADWDRLMQRILREVGPVTTEEFPYSLTLWRDGPAGHLQLDYDGDSANVEIPYRYPESEALPIMAEAYRIGRMVEEECGLEGYDYEVEQPVRTGDIDVAAARLGGIARWAQETLT
ncbi:hypothetical protein OIE61_42245 [Streptomyces sp. NBC_01762]|uniref:hypothetical protein n=1 Tax=unclassified Streptomyces TaxID=2593676 RepID=UPI002DDC8994|nr:MULTISPECIES: hypothetical protein [unclassified Streptomyces]WSC41584.1 hypothetical protein OHA08_42585 [Streptomyces sp. NBC_01763]WSC49970.1 hypothetical protein OIE61_42245 [Streptomyces sp. NBC_01762]